jgi:hypothetical protein
MGSESLEMAACAFLVGIGSVVCILYAGYHGARTGRVAVPPEPNPLLLGRGPLGPRADSAGPPPDRLAAR